MNKAFEEKINFFRQNTVTNWHEHLMLHGVTYEGCMEKATQMVEHMKICGIDRTFVMYCAMGGVRQPIEEIAKYNDYYGEICSKFPGVLYPLVYVDPSYGEEAIKEVARCKKEYNVFGVKLYNQYTIDDDIQDDLLSYCAKEGLFVLMHASRQGKYNTSLPNTTDAHHMIRAAQKHPDTVFIMAHIAGGGDWNYQLRGLEEYKNVYIDIGGSVLDEGTVEGVVGHFGADRVIFGTDFSFSASIGRILAAKISDEDKKMILHNTKLWDYATGGAK